MKLVILVTLWIVALFGVSLWILLSAIYRLACELYLGDDYVLNEVDRRTTHRGTHSSKPSRYNNSATISTSPWSGVLSNTPHVPHATLPIQPVNPNQNDLASALRNMGYDATTSKQIAKQTSIENPKLKLDQLIVAALKTKGD